LRCAVGPTNDDHPLVRAYHQVLVWDLSGTPVVSKVTRTTEHLLNPVLGKSLVVYARKPLRPATAGSDHGDADSGASADRTAGKAADQDEARIGA
jgi:hypothetical protein